MLRNMKFKYRFTFQAMSTAVDPSLRFLHKFPIVAKGLQISLLASQLGAVLVLGTVNERQQARNGRVFEEVLERFIADHRTALLQVCVTANEPTTAKIEGGGGFSYY